VLFFLFYKLLISELQYVPVRTRKSTLLKTEAQITICKAEGWFSSHFRNQKKSSAVQDSFFWQEEALLPKMSA
jgi:hypothetical protein